MVGLEARKSLVTKVNLFSDDDNDEFKVKLQNGENVGIFKTWAVPIIPIWEDSELKTEIKWDEIENWRKRLQQNPVLAWEVMEKWRGQTESWDRRLSNIFNERELPQNKTERVAELFWRLKTAFAFAAPFYHIEAMVGDGNDTPGNPFSEDLGRETAGGFLDMAGMLLPSALGQMVKAERLNWNGLSWPEIEKDVSSNIDINKLAITMRVARKAGIKVEEVLFAANALEWIPVSVGGKKNDLSEVEATKQLLASDLSPKITMGTVARDMNGLIRFLNWTPLVKSDINFSDAAWWKYAAVCETSNQIIEELSDGSLIDPAHKEEFLKVVLPQLKNLDASSARGRFALWMFENGWFGNDLAQKIKRSEMKIANEMMRRMAEMENEEAVIGLGMSNNRFLVGGKAAGLFEAQEIFGRQFVGEGLVVTSEAVNKWLKSNGVLDNKINQLEKEKGIGRKLKIAVEIRSEISRMSFTNEVVAKLKDNLAGTSFAIRSSSFDEDTLVNGSAAGIYESELKVPKEDFGMKLAKVVSSYFSEKAISYRHLHGLSDKPTFAMVIQEYLPGAGGVVFSKGDGNGWSVFTGETPGDIVSGKESFDRTECDGIKVSTEISHGWVQADAVELVGEMAILAEKILGGMTDMEFVVSEKGLKILQLRMLNKAEERGIKPKENPKKWVTLTDLNGLGTVVFKETSVGIVVDEKINIEQFQGELFRCLVRNKDKVSVVCLARKIPRTSHFANICLNLGIKLVFRDE